MSNVVAGIVGAIVMAGGLAAGYFIYSVGPGGIETLALATFFGGGIAGFGLFFLYTAFTSEASEGSVGIRLGGGPR